MATKNGRSNPLNIGDNIFSKKIPAKVFNNELISNKVLQSSKKSNNFGRLIGDRGRTGPGEFLMMRLSDDRNRKFSNMEFPDWRQLFVVRDSSLNDYKQIK
jgi:hypothetical protein